MMFTRWPLALNRVLVPFGFPASIVLAMVVSPSKLNPLAPSVSFVGTAKYAKPALTLNAPPFSAPQ